jgi:hypothetical protein
MYILLLLCGLRYTACPTCDCQNGLRDSDEAGGYNLDGINASQQKESIRYMNKVKDTGRKPDLMLQ